eukprot:123916-Hanusia_phi.AAC.4
MSGTANEIVSGTVMDSGSAQDGKEKVSMNFDSNSSVTKRFRQVLLTSVRKTKWMTARKTSFHQVFQTSTSEGFFSYKVDEGYEDINSEKKSFEEISTSISASIKSRLQTMVELEHLTEQ